MKNFFSTRWGIIATGTVIGVIAVLLQFLGNPPNMGICVACFERDIAGALSMHRASVVQYIRPEIIGFVFGSFLISLVFKEYKPRGGSSTIIRFFLGVFAMIGALVFLGCPWRALLRLAGGDGNAITGIAGLASGIGIGVLFLRNGYTLGRAYRTPRAGGWIFPGFMVLLFGLLILKLSFGDAVPLSLSEKGPGSMHASIWLSLATGGFIGIIAQRSRFCTMGAFRDLFLIRDFHLFTGIVSLAAAALIANLFLGQFNPGFAGQPVAHTNHIWNFLGMVLAGLCFTLAGGCPGRQLFMAGEGDSDAAVFVMGMIVGAALSHNLALASSPKGIGGLAPAAVIMGLVFCMVIGFTMKERIAS